MRNLLIFLPIILITTTLNSFALNPSRTYNQSPEKLGIEFTEHDVVTNDGANLKAWFMKSAILTDNLMLISHSGEGNMADYLERVQKFLSLGYNVVIYDYRGFGKSSEFDIDKNMYLYPGFLTDLDNMIDYCRDNFSKNLSLYGWGIGAGISLGVGYNRGEIVKIIADTPYLSIMDLESRFADWENPMDVPYGGVEKNKQPIYALGNEASKNLKGILIIIGSDDKLFKYEDMKTLAKMQKKITKIHGIINPNNIDNFMSNKEKYFEKIQWFLKK